MSKYFSICLCLCDSRAWSCVELLPCTWRTCCQSEKRDSPCHQVKSPCYSTNTHMHTQRNQSLCLINVSTSILQIGYFIVKEKVSANVINVKKVHFRRVAANFHHEHIKSSNQISFSQWIAYFTENINSNNNSTNQQIFWLHSERTNNKTVCLWTFCLKMT